MTQSPAGFTALPAEPYANRLVFDKDLNQTVIQNDTPLKTQIIVNAGTKIDSFRDPRKIDAGGGEF